MLLKRDMNDTVVNIKNIKFPVSKKFFGKIMPMFRITGGLSLMKFGMYLYLVANMKIEIKNYVL